MDVSQLSLGGGLLPYHDEGWMFVGEVCIAKEIYLRPVHVPDQLSLKATVSLWKSLNIMCRVS